MPNLLQKIGSFFERRSTLANPDESFVSMFAGKSTAAGRSVSPATALHYTTVYACVSLIAETVASLPLIIYRRRSDGGRDRANDHPLYSLLHDTPNEEMTSLNWRESGQATLLLWGNHFSKIEYDQAGRVHSIWPLSSSAMQVQRRGGKLHYTYNGNHIPAADLLHIPGLGFDGVIGKSPIAMAREAIGLGLSVEEFGARFFGAGTHPGGFLQHPGALGDEAYNRLKKSMKESYSGLGKSHKLMLLEDGVTYEQAGIPPEDAQFLQTRQFQRSEICGIFKVPGFMVGEMEKQSSWGTGVEQQQLGFVVHTIRPWLVRWEQAMTRRLLSEQDRKQGYFIEFLVDGLLRGDLKTRYDAYAVGRQNGWLSANEIRRLENMDPIDNGNIYLVPLNMVPVDQAVNPPDQEQNQAPGTRETRSAQAARDRHQQSFRRLFADVAGRLVRRETKTVGRAAKQHLGQRGQGDFSTWLDSYYDQFGQDMARDFLPLLTSFADAIQNEAATEVGAAPGMTPELERYIHNYSASLGKRYAASSKGQLQAIIAETPLDEILAAITLRLDEWQQRRPKKVASNETTQADNGVTRFVWAAAGVTMLKWVARGSKSCPFCQSLSGKVVGIRQPFVAKGAYQPEGYENSPWKVRGPKFTPPIHQGCTCTIKPA